MKRGAWHQFGDRSQKLVLEQLQGGAGVGVIISPRDLSFENAARYAPQYRELGADILVDQQFYIPDFNNELLNSYPLNNHRQAISSLTKMSEADISDLASQISAVNETLQATAVLAPAVIYESGRRDIVELNAKLFRAAKAAGDNLGLPTIATILIGHSATASTQLAEQVLSYATALNSDGWYFGFEFQADRVPAEVEPVSICINSGLILASTGKPVLHAYAGPMSLLSFAFGATATGIGHNQNLWQFSRERWLPAEQGGGGGGDAPARFFSNTLWGTIVYPDELIQLPRSLTGKIYTPSAFSQPSFAESPLPWGRWEANKHLVKIICNEISQIASLQGAKASAHYAISKLEAANNLYEQIRQRGVVLRDNSNAYHENWCTALENLLAQSEQELEYLEMIGTL
ncbi:MAG: hypothetical protein KF821_03370 [Anaerolineales bacterium]|nr:hypothetical protein [Anaerolineales bacterium]